MSGRLTGHLGSRVSDLIDGQLSPVEEERAWEHVHGCHVCRDLVEREGWVKTRLAGLAMPVAAPSRLHSSLLDTSALSPAGSPALSPALTPGEAFLLEPAGGPRPRRAGLVALGGGAAGAAVMGVLALGAAPAQAPTLSPRPPVTTISTPTSPVAVVGPARRLALP